MVFAPMVQSKRPGILNVMEHVLLVMQSMSDYHVKPNQAKSNALTELFLVRFAEEVYLIFVQRKSWLNILKIFALFLLKS